MIYIIEEMDLNIKIIYLEEYYKNGKKMQLKQKWMKPLKLLI